MDRAVSAATIKPRLGSNAARASSNPRWLGSRRVNEMKVPIKNALVVQIMRSIGIRKIRGLISSTSSQIRPSQPTSLPSTTSALVQLWTAPQWAQVNFCCLIFAAGQSFCLIVRPVSVSFEVEGQRTSKLFRSAPAFGFGRRRGGSK
jgi:hypothetical protein